MTLEEACALAEDISGVGIAVFHTDAQLQEFCSRFQFHDRQDYMEPFIMQTIWEQMNEDEAIATTDAFQVRLLFFRAGAENVLIGPYCTESFSERDCKLLFARKEINNVQSRDLLAYRSNIPVIANIRPQNLMQSILKSCGFSRIPDTLREIDFDSTFSPQTPPVIKRSYGDEVTERYRLESIFMDCIRQGDHVGAIRTWRKLHLSVSYMKHIGSTPLNAQVAAAINRTTIRIAAMEAGLSPIVNDQVSGASSDIIRSARTIDEIDHEHERIIREYCKRIRELNNRKYSSLVQSTRYYLEQKYPEELSIADIARDLEVTPSYLTAKFREETGITPHQYLLNVRLRHAENALLSGHESIQEISFQVGFADAGYFTRQFRQKYGCTPSQFRQQKSSGGDFHK